MSDWTPVCPVAELPAGEWKTADLEEVSVVVYNLEGEFYALENSCSHEFVCLAGLPLDGTSVVCPRHGAHFDVRTGEALTPPAYEPVATFPVKVIDDLIMVRDNRWD